MTTCRAKELLTLSDFLAFNRHKLYSQTFKQEKQKIRNLMCYIEQVLN